MPDGTPPDFTLPVVGAPYNNKDGSDRRFEILLCSRGEPLELRPEPRNKHDEHAVGVWSVRGVQIGYLPSQRAPYVKSLMRAGHELFGLFQESTSFGAAVRIGVDRVPTLPPERPKPRAAIDDEYNQDRAEDDGGYYADYIPPDD